MPDTDKPEQEKYNETGGGTIIKADACSFSDRLKRYTLRPRSLYTFLSPCPATKNSAFCDSGALRHSLLQHPPVESGYFGTG